MKQSKKFLNRKEFVKSAAAGITGLTLLNNPLNLFSSALRPPSTEKKNPEFLNSPLSLEPNMIGAYGPWAESLFGNTPGRLSFRNDDWQNIEEWKKVAQSRFRELLARPETGVDTLKVTVKSTYYYDGLTIQLLTWQLPYGPPTEAYFIKPQNATGPLPGILALHSHGGNKYFGKRKIAQVSDDQHPMLIPFQKQYYGGRSWANELAKQGFAVLVPDVFAFESRRVLVNDVSARIKRNAQDVTPEEREEDIIKYNKWASDHEHIMSKSLFCAGTTWPGVFVAEDQRALDVLVSQQEVDSNRIGCCGLSGGGLRSIYLSGIDSRIKTAVCVGMMSTWKDFLKYNSYTHTWMIYVPLLPKEMDYSEIFSLQIPSSRLVLNNSDDSIFNIKEQKRADRILKEVFEKAGVAEYYASEFHPGPHKFDLAMQESAFKWLEKWLK